MKKPDLYQRFYFDDGSTHALLRRDVLKTEQAQLLELAKATGDYEPLNRWLENRAHEGFQSNAYSRYRIAQAEKASLGAQARWAGEDRDLLGEIIKRLATKKEWGEYPEPSELWLKLFGDMDSAGLEPRETGEAYTYGNGETITRGAFRKQVQRLRQLK